MSNAERQREFRRRHPGYYARIKARERAMAKQSTEKYIRERRAAFQAMLKAEAEAAAAEAASSELATQAPTAC